MLFSERSYLSDLYYKWIEEHHVKDCSSSVIAFLEINYLINQDNARDFIRRNGYKNRLFEPYVNYKSIQEED